MALDRLTNITRSGLGSVHSYDVAGLVAVGVVTASSFSGNITGNITGNIVGDVTGDVTGNVTGNVTGTATTATNLANAANITTGTISNDRLPATITKNLTGNVTGNVTGNTSGTAGGLTGSPSITVTDITATGNVSIGGTLTYEDVTNIDSVGVVTARAGVKVPDSQKIFLGTGDDLSIYHNGTDSYVDNQTGDLILRTSSVGDDVFVRAMDDVFIQPGNGANGVTVKGSGAVELYYDNAKKFETHSSGVVISGNLQLNDNNLAYFGSSQDLQIYHNGAQNLIISATGQVLETRADTFQVTNSGGTENLLQAIGDGAVNLYHNGTKKFETTTTGAKVTGTLDLAAIDSSITRTATDIFVYDTRKDSDGGAWRKRTQHTSWYNETLNTSTRGSRKEFPAVAVIVAEQNFIRIYDGDDPDLPMWMVFNTIANGASQGMADRPMIQIQGVDKVVYALNGILATGTRNEGSNYGQPVINFISEKVLRMDSQGGEGGEWMGTIAQRNEAIGYRSVDYDYVIAASRVNDIAMTVLPNASIDDATGLPVPTIAVATDRGVSIIKDDGSVANLEHDGGTHETCRNIAFSEDKTKVLFTSDYNDDPTYNRRVIVEDIPSGDSTFTVVQDDSYQIAVGGYDNNGPRILGTSNGSSAVGGIDHLLSQAAATSEGVTLLDNELDNILKSKVAYVTADYNTGWMVGDIKGAFLSDTDTTNATYTTVADDWATAAAWTKQSSISLTSTGSGTSGTVSITGNGTGSNVYFFNAITVEANTDYIITVTFGAYNANEFYINDNPYTTANKLVNINALSGLTRGGHFNSGSHTTLYIQGYQVSTTATTITNVVVQKVSEKDRCVNNKGLQVYGTITKQPVATGAELVSYTGWSSSNYLRHPYNSGLDFGTGEWSYMFWYNPNDAESGDVIFSRWSYNVDGNQAPRISAYFNSGNLRVDTADASAGSGYQGHFGSDGTQDSNEWHCAVILRRGPRLEIWIDGIKYKDAALNSTSDGSYTDSNSILEIGHSPGNGAPEAGLELALFRVSATAPSAEQIKKIYEDEKHLFQENAKATLYGSSDAVTALGYDEDTELLHIGTSSGRSDFQGLRRINNTTTAVTTAISASDELIAEQ